MNVAFVGCGYVADFYMATLPNHPELQLTGVFDREKERAKRFAAFHGLHQYPSLEALLGDDRVSMVVNLTNPGSHFEVSWQALQHGKHVYSEKPLATVMGRTARPAAGVGTLQCPRGECADPLEGVAGG
jgi:predicted dehydrogenase